MKKYVEIILIVLLLAVFTFLLTAVSAFDTRLKVVQYTINSPKISNEIKFALITDLHSCSYGEEMEQLVSKIEKRKPDAVLLVGDIFDDWMPDDNAKTFVSTVAKNYPIYYVSGNHEWWSARMEEFFSFLRENNVTVLRGECHVLNINGQYVNICGIDDPDAVNYDFEYKGMEEQLENADEQASDEKFSLLLAHRPEYAAKYFEYSFDCVVSGHAHGGQWRIPVVLNGLYAPNQGFFPKLAGGMYDFSGKNLIVSRGLSKENQSIPRIFNRPEIVFITVK